MSLMNASVETLRNGTKVLKGFYETGTYAPIYKRKIVKFPDGTIYKGDFADCGVTDVVKIKNGKCTFFDGDCARPYTRDEVLRTERQIREIEQFSKDASSASSAYGKALIK